MIYKADMNNLKKVHDLFKACLLLFINYLKNFGDTKNENFTNYN